MRRRAPTDRNVGMKRVACIRDWDESDGNEQHIAVSVSVAVDNNNGEASKTLRKRNGEIQFPHGFCV